jgi:hypothetical protein
VSRGRVATWVGGALLVVALAMVPLWLGWSSTPELAGGPADLATPLPPDPTGPAGSTEPAADPPGDPSDGLAEAPDPVVTAQPDISPAPIPTPDPDTAAALAGTARAEDGTGDVTDSAGAPADDAAAADLVEVALDGEGETLAVTWRVAGAIPPSVAGSLLWSVDLHDGEELAASITAQLIGARQVAGVLDWGTGAQTTLPDQPEIAGDTVRVVLPISALPRIAGPVTWTALGQLDGGLEDRVPDAGRERFPQ